MKRRNYGFDRRRREDLRRAKQEAKTQRKTDREASGSVVLGEPGAHSGDTAAHPPAR